MGLHYTHGRAKSWVRSLLTCLPLVNRCYACALDLVLLTLHVFLFTIRHVDHCLFIVLVCLFVCLCATAQEYTSVKNILKDMGIKSIQLMVRLLSQAKCSPCWCGSHHARFLRNEACTSYSIDCVHSMPCSQTDTSAASSSLSTALTQDLRC